MTDTNLAKLAFKFKLEPNGEQRRFSAGQQVVPDLYITIYSSNAGKTSENILRK